MAKHMVKVLPPIQPEVSLEVRRFCAKHGIEQYLSSTIELVKSCFEDIRELYLEIEEDPETGEEWLSINVTVAGTIEEVLASYEQYTSRLLSRVPWPQRSKFRLSYNIV